MDEFAYKNFYDTVGKMNGWDFSKVKCHTEGTAWNFYDEVVQSCKRSDLLLDIGTGGGEALLNITEAALLLVGIDISSGMIETANRNLTTSQKMNVRFLQMAAENLDFPANFFNVVSCRQSNFSANQVAKVLVPQGVFLTQQVSEDDKLNIKQAFKRGQNFGITDGTLKNKYIKELTEAGFSDIHSFDFVTTEFYETYEDLIFLLKHTPIIPKFGQYEHDFDLLHTFIAENQTEKGIRTNAKRFVIIAKK
ncbi:class I SAM-dependent methyltransferase [Paenibacillus eucommiae]|uniref:Ubiquinone/menaquinone biosynthesis C-methylase UbiE n=1 Tax=Paenibacillus eucommiae TaxID=1355755 RepID=A0ABS4IZ56_9BACL|nr:class I SAM-dependent methyltransferase [Paenibacillus eucommiae]MBP1992251.1 ubiquinone/menaquinone biosynthesis C-methylase UbiE [Paenibacillus eucommiae]